MSRTVPLCPFNSIEWDGLKCTIYVTWPGFDGSNPAKLIEIDGVKASDIVLLAVRDIGPLLLDTRVPQRFCHYVRELSQQSGHLYFGITGKATVKYVTKASKALKTKELAATVECYVTATITRLVPLMKRMRENMDGITADPTFVSPFSYLMSHGCDLVVSAPEFENRSYVLLSIDGFTKNELLAYAFRRNGYRTANIGFACRFPMMMQCLALERGVACFVTRQKAHVVVREIDSNKTQSRVLPANRLRHQESAMHDHDRKSERRTPPRYSQASPFTPAVKEREEIIASQPLPTAAVLAMFFLDNKQLKGASIRSSQFNGEVLLKDQLLTFTIRDALYWRQRYRYCSGDDKRWIHGVPSTMVPACAVAAAARERLEDAGEPADRRLDASPFTSVRLDEPTDTILVRMYEAGEREVRLVTVGSFRTRRILQHVRSKHGRPAARCGLAEKFPCYIAEMADEKGGTGFVDRKYIHVTYIENGTQAAFTRRARVTRSRYASSVEAEEREGRRACVGGGGGGAESGIAGPAGEAFATARSSSSSSVASALSGANGCKNGATAGEAEGDTEIAKEAGDDEGGDKRTEPCGDLHCSPFTFLRCDQEVNRIVVRAPEFGDEYVELRYLDGICKGRIIGHVRASESAKMLGEGFAEHFPRYVAEVVLRGDIRSSFPTRKRCVVQYALLGSRKEEVLTKVLPATAERHHEACLQRYTYPLAVRNTGYQRWLPTLSKDMEGTFYVERYPPPLESTLAQFAEELSKKKGGNGQRKVPSAEEIIARYAAVSLDKAREPKWGCAAYAVTEPIFPFIAVWYDRTLRMVMFEAPEMWNYQLHLLFLDNISEAELVQEAERLYGPQWTETSSLPQLIINCVAHLTTRKNLTTFLQSGYAHVGFTTCEGYQIGALEMKATAFRMQQATKNACKDINYARIAVSHEEPKRKQEEEGMAKKNKASAKAASNGKEKREAADPTTSPANHTEGEGDGKNATGDLEEDAKGMEEEAEEEDGEASTLHPAPFTFMKWDAADKSIHVGLKDRSLGEAQLLAIDGLTVAAVVEHAKSEGGKKTWYRNLHRKFPRYVHTLAAKEEGRACFATTGRAAVQILRLTTGKTTRLLLDAEGNTIVDAAAGGAGEAAKSSPTTPDALSSLPQTPQVTTKKDDTAAAVFQQRRSDTSEDKLKKTAKHQAAHAVEGERGREDEEDQAATGPAATSAGAGDTPSSAEAEEGATTVAAAAASAQEVQCTASRPAAMDTRAFVTHILRGHVAGALVAASDMGLTVAQMNQAFAEALRRSSSSSSSPPISISSSPPSKRG